jgi:hypothetical protein
LQDPGHAIRPVTGGHGCTARTSCVQLMLGQTQQPRGEQPWSYGTDARKLLFFCARNDVVRYTTKELLDIAAQCTTNEEVVGSLLVLGGREVAPNNSRATPYNIVVQGAKKDAKDGKKR